MEADGYASAEGRGLESWASRKAILVLSGQAKDLNLAFADTYSFCFHNLSYESINFLVFAKMLEGRLKSPWVSEEEYLFPRMENLGARTGCRWTFQRGLVL